MGAIEHVGDEAMQMLIRRGIWVEADIRQAAGTVNFSSATACANWIA